MAAHILRMSDSETMKFLKYYKNEPVLWDARRDEYKKREMRLAAAMRIADAMSLDGFTHIHVLMKFKNLRSSYLQELKKISESQKIALSANDIYTPKVIWFKLMDSFIRPHIRTRISRNVSDTEDQDFYANVNYDNTSSDDMFHDDNDSEFQDFGRKNLECDTPMPPHKIKRQPSPTHSDMTYVMEKQNKSSESAENSNSCAKKDDVFDHFGQYIASLLRALPQERSFQLQSEIVAMILTPLSSIQMNVRPSVGNTYSETYEHIQPSSRDLKM